MRLQPPPMSDADRYEVAMTLQTERRQQNPDFTVWLESDQLSGRDAAYGPRYFIPWVDALAELGRLPEPKTKAPARLYQHGPYRRGAYPAGQFRRKRDLL